MDYPFENLNPEKFQQFCQALLTKEFRDVQCFPVAEPDGGRDALSYEVFTDGEHRKDFIMFQVKFVRKPFAETDPHRWLVNILEKEVPKVKRQIPKGAKQFFLLTNIPGTAHPEVGSIDKVNEILRRELEVPSTCWWRDDLSRRLDNAWDLKWVYPELMTGPDLIRSLVESGLSDNRERRTAAIRAFLQEQFTLDQEVKFKQVDLQNKLLDLFIDVPISSPPRSAERKVLFQFHRAERLVVQDLSRNYSRNSQIEEEPISPLDLDQEFYASREGRSVGAATFLLHSYVQAQIPRIVLEGAPGQGKSTIAQYVCQVHRMRLLDKEEELQSLPEYHRSIPIRLPLKIDLRDLATWLLGQDPFLSSENDLSRSGGQRSLETFLAALIKYHAGGIDFSVVDLLAVAKSSAVLLVFDGLDEVADITRRQEVVNEIVNGVNRLEANTASLQVLVTSRPSAFVNSPGLPERKFPYCQLDSLTRQRIDEYADKWTKARKLSGRDGGNLKKILREKLNQPHLRDLARNPMQLTILLSLIHTRGSSLPDKRTALYDSYINLFFDREAEKSSVVRDHRDLLVNIHRYLAWELHAGAEMKNNSGSISEEKLRKCLAEYLVAEGYDPGLAGVLFSGMVERVVALVSRVQGTYEFEVQPLREYFAARYLYETAPYSPPGGEKKGTKPDRFDAIARNFYWLNVTRFYAGCYSKGELASLIDRLQELTKEDGYRLVSHPRLLAAMLLSDWVFTQHPKSVREVVALILDGIGLRYILSSSSRRFGTGSPLILPKECGRDELVVHCFSILRKGPPLDYALDVIDVIRSNTPSDEIVDQWYKETVSQHGPGRAQWLHYGLQLGALGKIPLADLCTLLSDNVGYLDHTSTLFRARRFDYFEMNEINFENAILAILSRDIQSERGRRIQHALEMLTSAVDAARYAVAFHSASPRPLATLWDNSIWVHDRRMAISEFSKEKILEKFQFSGVDKFHQVVDLIERLARVSSKDWATLLTPWDTLIEESRKIWGDHWAFFHLANVSSGIKSKAETGKDFTDLLDPSKPLCGRARYARLRAGGASLWWKEQFNQAKDEIDSMFITLVVVTWSSWGTLAQVLTDIDDILERLSPDNWLRLYRSVEETLTLTQRSTERLFHLALDKINHVGVRTLALFAKRSRNRMELYSRYLSSYEGSDPVVLQFCQESALAQLKSGNPNWQHLLKVVEQSYKQGVISQAYEFQRLSRIERTEFLPMEIAQEITVNADRYPGFLVAIAEIQCRKQLTQRIVPVGEVALRDSWFGVQES